MEASEREIASAPASNEPVPATLASAAASATSSSDFKLVEDETLLPGGFHAFKPSYGDDSSPVTNTQRPKTDAVITIRVIKSFEYRTMKALVLKGIDLTTLTAGELKQRCKQGAQRRHDM